ncbi:Formylglycine-generating enzyme [Paramyrothecium foliicola]|nr:Formylglycine-generating enzyme [Paramyrothecium foliicola]
MLKFVTQCVACSVLLAPGLVSAASVEEVRAKLAALAETLQWQGSMYPTYAPALDAAIQARDAIASVDAGTYPQAAVALESLGRLITESKYFTDESSNPEYVPHPLESNEYLTANVDEWRYAVKVLSDRFEQPVCDILSNLPSPQAASIDASAVPGTEFRDSDLTPTMVVLPTGSYTAGSTPEEHARWRVPDDKKAFEYPQRTVTISKPLAFSRTEVTVGQFDTFVKSTCYQLRGGSRWWDPENPDFFGFNGALTYDQPGFPQTPDHPVVAVRRADAQAYARWLSAITGKTYRLPNEDEWEWAARGGTQTVFFWGNELKPNGSQYANTYDTAAHAANGFRWPSNNMTDGFPHTAPVGSFKPNGYGLYDVTANAREFMADDWIENLGPEAHDGSIHKGPAPFPVVRGGAWNYNPRNLRINYRSAYFSSEVATNMFGIRLVREL